MKKYLLLLLILLPGQRVFSQNSGINTQPPSITISGFISDSCLASFGPHPEITFYYSHNKHEYYREAHVVPLEIRANRFMVKFKPKYDVCYVLFNGIYVNCGLDGGLFMLQAGDSLEVRMNSIRSITFAGKGSEILNYQLWFGKQLFKPSKTFKGDDSLHLNYFREFTSNILGEALDSLNQHHTTWDPGIQRLLKVNTVTAVNWHYLALINCGNLNSIDGNDRQTLLSELQYIYNQQNSFAQTDDFILTRAYIYIEYLFDLNFTYARLLSNSNKPPFEVFYKLIDQNYEGLLRDRLLAYFFEDRVKSYPEAMQYLPRILLSMKDSASIALLQQLRESNTQGARAFDFNFTALNGKAVKLQDFKGKIIVMDTYFNGCLGCIGLTRQMKPVIDHFKGNKEVVFLGINVDKSRQKFIESVKSGLYTHKETINAYTNGLGQFDPMLVYYHYYSFPNLLIIDKNGRVISANPPRPINEKARKEFIALIENHF
ncbi:MAG: hypothetical protein JWR50_830 [Mucilaginibacter sp.]|nr:hypothetical protein [Mucilaginibacter sp.]